LVWRYHKNPFHKHNHKLLTEELIFLSLILKVNKILFLSFGKVFLEVKAILEGERDGCIGRFYGNFIRING
jgi:hypothetical protein